MDIIEKEHKKIIALIEKLFSVSTLIPQSLKYNGVSYAEHGEYFQWLNHQIGSLDDAFQLLKTSYSYKSIFNIIRSSFEGYWVLLLTMNGGIFYKKFIAKNRTSANTIHAKWMADKADPMLANDWKNVVNIERVGRKDIHVTYKGLYENQNKSLIPYYYFLFKEYDPTNAYLGNEPRLIDHYLSRPKALQRDFKEAKYLNHYFDITSGLKNHLLLNKFIDEKGWQKLLVHYNFLSLWAHPNIKQIEFIDRNNVGTYDKYTKHKYNFVLTLLGFLYIGCLLSLFINLYIKSSDRWVKENKIKGIKWKRSMNTAVNGFDKHTDYFWFIYNKPHAFYKFNYCVQRLWRSSLLKRKIKVVQPDQLPDSLIPYYKNPYSIIKNILMSGKNPLCGIYKSPIKTSDRQSYS